MMNSLKFTIYVKRLQPCPAVTRNMKKKYKNTLADTHTQYPFVQKNFQGKKKDKQRWKPCPAAIISSVTWWVFSFKLVRSSAPQQRYLGICHSHIKLPSAGLFSHRTWCQPDAETSLFSCLKCWGSGVGERVWDIMVVGGGKPGMPVSVFPCVHTTPALQSIMRFSSDPISVLL